MAQGNEKRQQRRRRAKWLFPVRVATMMVAGMAGAWLLFQLMVKVVHPYKLGYEQAQKVADLKDEWERIEAGNVRLRQQVAYLQSPEGAETIARRNGYHRPGEIVYLLDRDAARMVENTSDTASPTPDETKRADATPSPVVSPTSSPRPSPESDTL
jgi:cell division protein FtsB